MNSNATSTHITDTETSASSAPSQGPSSLPTGESTSSTPAPQSNKATGQSSKERFTKQDIETILTFLEHPPNFVSVFGSGGQTTIGKPNKPSNQGYTTLAQVVSRQSKGRLNLNAKSMRERLARHRKTFATVKEKSQETGFGVTDEDQQKGIYTIGHKLESICTCYDRMDALFGSRPNVTPLGIFSSVIPVAQEQDSSQQPTTGPRRRRRLLEDEDEDEDEDEGGDDDEPRDLVKDVGGEPFGNYTQTQDNIDNPDPFNNTFDDSFNDIDYNLNNFDTGLDTAETTNLEDDRNNIDSVLEGDDISVLSISSTQVLRRHQKRPHTDTESQASNKRTRTTDRRKKQPTLDPPSSPEVSRRSFLSSFEQATTKKANETKRLELEENKLEWEKSRESRKLDLEEQRESRKLELEEQKMERESRKLELEQQKIDQESKRWKSEMETRVTVQTLQVIQAGLEKGVSVEQIQAMLKTVIPR
ncbi:hypothetical protein KI688_003224 [Linnemannia hyalina]|uniref:Uncharacterized protein n=1 Tax=Linnemannia hyalina TaxID=64524 RepID=A0A9P8BQ65_9FUNG|nr:hypothetical protein KI688_003224 [Linnemannia hyalina]